jgi:hypothetical protein
MKIKKVVDLGTAEVGLNVDVEDIKNELVEAAGVKP